MNDYAFTAPSIMDVVIKLTGLNLLEMNYMDGQTFITAADGNAYMIIETDKPYLLLRCNTQLSVQQLEVMKVYSATVGNVPTFPGGDFIPRRL